ncbi:hypothetical protein [Brevundimonas nasdae]|uniref:hypothetical protein n=1 Tax=Brevundimonas nasdae TaxID=172043 RepID=UPI003F690BC1
MTHDLFGEAPRTEPKAGEIALALVLHGQTDKAWLLAETIYQRDAQWAPKSHAKRGEGRDENVWTMPTWLARERGWM